MEWQDEDGNAVSYDAEYSFEVTGDVTLTAVFAPEQPAEVEDEPGEETENGAEDDSGVKDTPAAPLKDDVILPAPDDDESSNTDDGGDGNGA